MRPGWLGKASQAAKFSRRGAGNSVTNKERKREKAKSRRRGKIHSEKAEQKEILTNKSLKPHISARLAIPLANRGM